MVMVFKSEDKEDIQFPSVRRAVMSFYTTTVPSAWTKPVIT